MAFYHTRFFFSLPFSSFVYYYTMSSKFDIERDNLMEEVSHGLKLIVNNLDELNDSLDIINTIGKEFEQPANVWHRFHTSLMSPMSHPPIQQNELLHDTKTQESKSIRSQLLSLNSPHRP
ncbi:hypothetical protein BC941DRAFT_439383 [Chlamydoabsidia padenii]|nr:hypothetical protein BC941DRAFT_439383 [Chlamydoabsidia padenii]